MCKEERKEKESIPVLFNRVPDVAGVHHDKKKIECDTFIEERRRRENEGRRKRGEEELVGRVVDGGKNIKKNKEEKEKR